ncbi:MAG: SGNH/GDSL hydrolase family protein [Micromonosporaceae bacterium]|nr:SGNH/GDSL hydrolase family protein [Micromonosporaceae bacterium]
MSLVRRLGKATAITMIAGTVGGAALLAAEALAARTRRYAQPDLRLAMRTSVGEDGVPLRLVLLGDSTALGVGVGRVGDTVGGRLAELLAEQAGTGVAGRGPLAGTDSAGVAGRRPLAGAGSAGVAGDGRRVELSSVAVHGSRSADLATQVARALLGPTPDVAVILVGANDVVGLRRPGEAAAHLAAAVSRLGDAGVAVVVGTCPDLGAARAIAQPLRQLVALQARRMARAQAAAVREAGGVPVDLAGRTGAVFRADAGTLCEDRYHPSADGYRVWAHALLPAVVEAARLRTAATEE